MIVRPGLREGGARDRSASESRFRTGAIGRFIWAGINGPGPDKWHGEMGLLFDLIPKTGEEALPILDLPVLPTMISTGGYE